MAALEIITRIESNDPKLKSASLSGLLVDSPELVSRLAEGLKTNTNLVHLNLQNNHLKNAGITVLVEGLAENDSLQRLELEGNDIGTRGGFLVWRAMGERHLGATCGMLTYENVLQDALLRLQRVGIDETTAMRFIKDDRNTRGMKAYCRDLMSGKFLQAEFMRHDDVARSLATRVRYLKYIQEHPEVHDVVIKRPVVLTGLYRTGTTLLFNLMAQSDGVRAPLLWEILEPVPPPTRDTYHSDARIGAAQFFAENTMKLGLVNQSVHNLDPLWPEECMFVMRNHFYWSEYYVAGVAPNYLEWFAQQPIKSVYESCREFYQVLSSKYPPDSHWVMKAPYHLLNLDLLVEAYSPDETCIVFCHRDPIESVASSLSLWVALGKSEWRDYNVVPACRRMFDILAQMWERGLAFINDMERKGLGHRLYHVQYRDVLKDPIQVVKNIHERFHLAPVNIDAVQGWLDDNPQGKHGKHKYTLEQFGITKQDVYTAFHDYYLRFFPELLPTEQPASKL